MILRWSMDRIKKRYSFLFLIVLYRVLLDIYYYKIISQDWGYMGFSLEVTIRKMVISYFVMIVLYGGIRWEENSISTCILKSMYIVMIIPLLSFYGMANKDTVFILSCSFGFYITTKLGQYKSDIPIKTHIDLKKYFKHKEIIGIIIIIGVLIYQFRTYGFHLGAFDFINPYVYEIRDIISEKGSNSLFEYFITWGYKMICPFILAYYLSKKNRKMVICMIIIQLLIYLTNPHKEILFSIVLVFVAYYAIRAKKIEQLLTFGFLFILLIDIFLYGTKLETYSSSIIRRLLYIPAEIKYEHFDFFSKSEKLFFSEGKIGKILGLHYPYGNSSVGEVVHGFFHNTYSNSNAGYLAYGYDNLGVWGTLIDSSIVGLILMYIQRITHRNNATFVSAAIIYIFIQLNDLPLQTTLLTGGLGLLMIILFFMASFKSNSDDIYISIEEYL